jgi:hypothetical protein
LQRTKWAAYAGIGKERKNTCAAARLRGGLAFSLYITLYYKVALIAGFSGDLPGSRSATVAGDD